MCYQDTQRFMIFLFVVVFDPVKCNIVRRNFEPCSCPEEPMGSFVENGGKKALHTNTFIIHTLKTVNTFGCAHACTATEGCQAMQVKQITDSAVLCNLLNSNSTISDVKRHSAWNHFDRTGYCHSACTYAQEQLSVLAITPSTVHSTTSKISITVRYSGDYLNAHTGGELKVFVFSSSDRKQKYGKANVALNFDGATAAAEGVQYSSSGPMRHQVVHIPLDSTKQLVAGSYTAKLWVAPFFSDFSFQVASTEVIFAVSNDSSQSKNFVAIVHTLPPVLSSHESMLSVFVKYNFSHVYATCPKKPRSVVKIKVSAHLKDTSKVIGRNEYTPIGSTGDAEVLLEIPEKYTSIFTDHEVVLSVKGAMTTYSQTIGCPSEASLMGTIGHDAELFESSTQTIIAYNAESIQDGTIEIQRISPSEIVSSTRKVTFTYFVRAPVCATGLCVVRYKVKQGKVIAKGVVSITTHESHSIPIGVDLTKAKVGRIYVEARILPTGKSKWKREYLRESVSSFTVHPTATTPQCNNNMPAHNNKKNVLFVVIDDLGTQLGVYGDHNAKTPNFDALAAKGTTFTSQYVDFPVCIPSRIATLTGVRALQSTQLFEDPHFWNIPGINTMPGVFQSAGYTTYTLGKIFHLSDTYGLNNHFGGSRSSKFASRSLNAEVDAGAFVKTRCESTFPSSEFIDAPDERYTDGRVATRAVDILEQHKISQEPFWMAVGFNKPHLPFVAPKRFHDMYDDGNITLPKMKWPKQAPLSGHNNWGGVAKMKMPEGFHCFDEISRPGARDLTRDYLASVSYVDFLLGRVLRGLDCMIKNTLIIVWSDHGYHLGEQALWAKNTMFEMATRSPLIVVDPDPLYHKTATQAGIVEAVDIFPTMLHMCNIAKKHHPETLSGKSFAPLMLEPTMEWDFGALSFQGGASKMFVYSLRTRDYRYTIRLSAKALESEFLFQSGEINRETADSVEDTEHRVEETESFDDDLMLGIMGVAPIPLSRFVQNYSAPELLRWLQSFDLNDGFEDAELYDLRDSRMEKVNVVNDPLYATVAKDMFDAILEYKY